MVPPVPPAESTGNPVSVSVSVPGAGASDVFLQKQQFYEKQVRRFSTLSNEDVATAVATLVVLVVETDRDPS